MTCSGLEGCGMVLEWLGSLKPLAWYGDILLTLAGLGTGLRAAYLWLQSAKIEVNPGWRYGEPADRQVAMEGWMVGLLEASMESASLNARAARWTAGAVILGGVGGLLGVLLT